MKSVYFITGNKAKVIYAQKILADFNIQVNQKKLELIESRDENPEDVVTDKALQSIRIFQQPLIVEDCGLFINALNGFPKTYTNFCVNTLGLSGFLKLMENNKDRSAEFRSALAYIDPILKEPKIFIDIYKGFTLSETIGDSTGLSFGEIDRLLIGPGETKTSSTLTPEYRAQKEYQRKTESHYYHFGEWYTQLK